MSIFSQRLRLLKSERNLKQTEIAAIAKTSATNISRYINDEREPVVEYLVNIAKGLDVSTDFLLGLSDVEKPKIELNADQRILIAAFNRASERDVNVIWSLLEPYITETEKEYWSRSKKDDTAG